MLKLLYRLLYNRKSNYNCITLLLTFTGLGYKRIIVPEMNRVQIIVLNRKVITRTAKVFVSEVLAETEVPGAGYYMKLSRIRTDIKNNGQYVIG